MRKKENIERATADEIRTMLASGADQTDWPRVKSMSQAEVERLADEDDGPLPENWADSISLGVAEPKQGVHIRLDPMILRWFKTQGPGYQTRINAVLRAFVESKQRQSDPTTNRVDLPPR
jgi:uncharacterized protein (DUF4415 family)